MLSEENSLQSQSCRSSFHACFVRIIHCFVCATEKLYHTIHFCSVCLPPSASLLVGLGAQTSCRQRRRGRLVEGSIEVRGEEGRRRSFSLFRIDHQEGKETPLPYSSSGELESRRGESPIGDEKEEEKSYAFPMAKVLCTVGKE